MKNKKFTINLVSHLAELILQYRISPSKHFVDKIKKIQQQIQSMHYSNVYQLDLYSSLIEKEQYFIQKRLNLKPNRILVDGSICIKFKIIEKTNFSMEYVQSWLITYEKLQIVNLNEKANFNQELINLLQNVLRSLKCQFLFSELVMSQQFKKRFMVDFQIEANPSKKYFKQISTLSYEKVWKKQARVDTSNNITVTCFHKQSQRIKSIIIKQHEAENTEANQINFTDILIFKPKRGSEDTNACTSGEYQWDESHAFECFDIQAQGRCRKSSVIQFYDDELNITVLSNDSDSFKKSSGKIQGVYDRQEGQSSDDEFQLMIEESKQDQLHNKQVQRVRQLNILLKNIVSESQEVFLQLDSLLNQYWR